MSATDARKSSAVHESGKPQLDNPICVFTKPFNSLNFDQFADQIAELGVDGIEAPIRQGGHIEPKNITTELPKLVEALAKRNLAVTILTSDINNPNDPQSK